MDAAMLVVKAGVVAVFAASAVYAHLRGRVRHPIARQLTDHSTFLAPINALLYAFSDVHAQPFADLQRFPQLDVLQAHWQTIRDEGLRLLDDGFIRAAASYNDVGFNSFFRTGWKRFYLKWYDDFLPSARAMCPQTSALLAEIPGINAAMFALLPPGAKLVAHRDPYAGSLRYHLGLSTPNSELCRIVVDGESYHWEDGKAVLFDETYIHWAENRADTTRLILFCDVERPMRNRLAGAFNHAVAHTLIRSAATQNLPGEHVGMLNRIFGVVYRVRLLGKRIKAWNRRVYYLIKWLLIGGVLAAIFL